MDHNDNLEFELEDILREFGDYSGQDPIPQETEQAEPPVQTEEEPEKVSGDTIRLELPMEARISRWYHQSAAVEVGPLLMAYQPEEKWTAIDEKCGVKTWQVEAASPWNYALVNDEPMKVVFEKENIAPFGQKQPAVSVLVKAARVSDWGMNGANCAVTPIAPAVKKADVETIRLVPYGSTGLRISQFPVANVIE